MYYLNQLRKSSVKGDPDPALELIGRLPKKVDWFEINYRVIVSDKGSDKGEARLF
jgi:hypothetical protein